MTPYTPKQGCFGPRSGKHRVAHPDLTGGHVFEIDATTLSMDLARQGSFAPCRAVSGKHGAAAFLRRS